MTSYVPNAQDILLCDLCDKVPLQMHCNKCAVSLCKVCMADHVINDSSKVHEVVAYKMRNVDPVFPDCQTHSNHKCEMYCQECDIPLCVKCIISGSHKNHDVIGMADVLKSKKETLQQISKGLEHSVYPKYEDCISKLENLISKLPESYQELISAISEHGDTWHREIDIIINRTKQEVQKMKEKDIYTLNKNLDDLKNLQSVLYKFIMDFRKILKSNNVTETITCTASSEILEFGNPEEIAYSPPKFVPTPIQGEQLRNLFGTLIASSVSETQTNATVDRALQPEIEVLDWPTEESSIDTETNNLTSVACLSPSEVWVCGNSNKIQRFHMDGSLQQTVTTTTGNTPVALSVTPQGELVYTDVTDRSIYIVRHETPEKMITIQDYCPLTACSTASGDLLVAMFKKEDKTPKKVVRFRGSIEKQVIQFDQDGNSLFSTAYDNFFIAENGNGDLCASDSAVKTVVVINQEEKIRFRYTGNLSCNKHTSFTPCGISTDVLNQILVVDGDNNCIHVIHQDGHFIRYIDNCQLTDPFHLSINGNFLFVGEVNTGKVKKIMYLT